MSRVVRGVIQWPVVADELKDLRTKLWLGFRKHQHNRDLFKMLWDYVKRVVVSEWAQHTGRFIRPQLQVDQHLIKMWPCHVNVRDNVDQWTPQDNDYCYLHCNVTERRRNRHDFKWEKHRTWTWCNKGLPPLVRFPEGYE